MPVALRLARVGGAPTLPVTAVSIDVAKFDTKSNAETAATRAR